MKYGSVLAITMMVLCLAINAIPLHAATYEYDPLGRLTKVTYDSGQEMLYTYDAAGNMLAAALVTPEGLPLPPVLEPIDRRSIMEGRLLQFTIAGSDIQNDPLSFAAADLPRGASFNPFTRTFTWTPDYDQAGEYAVRFIVSDGTLTDLEDVPITVQDDPAAPTLSISDITGAEGDSGLTGAAFTVRLSAPSAREVTVIYETTDGTAAAGSDYTAQTGRLVFPAGALSRTIEILVKGDTLDEADEIFALNLHTPSYAAIGNGRGICTIADDDQGAVIMAPVDPTTGTTPVTISFPADTGAGVTVDLATRSTGPPPPSGFQLGDPPVYYELTSSAPLAGPATVAISYAGVAYANEGAIRLYHYENGTWVDRTLWVDTTNNVIYAVVTSFSPFAVFEPSAAIRLEAPLTWARTIRNSGKDILRALSGTADGGYVAAGETLDSDGNSEAWIVRLDMLGNIVWQRSYGGASEDAACSVVQTADGGYVVAGLSKSFGAGGADLWVLRLDATGGVIWQKTYGGPGNDAACAVRQSMDGDLLVAGTTRSSGAGGADAWAMRLDATGAVIWQKTYGGPADEILAALELTTDGGAILAGRTGSFGAGGTDALIIQIDREGRMIWQAVHGGPADESIASISPTGDGGFIAAGATASCGAGLNDAWLLKMDAAGRAIWQKTYGGAKDEAIASVRQTADRGYVVAGYTESAGAGPEFWAAKLSESGLIDWQKVYTATLPDTTQAVLTCGDGGIIAAGTAAGGDGAACYLVMRCDAHGQVESQRYLAAAAHLLPGDGLAKAIASFPTPTELTSTLPASDGGAVGAETKGVQGSLFPYGETFGAYVANNTADSIAAFRFDPTTGFYTAVPGAPFAAGKGPQAIAVDNASRFVCVINGGEASVAVYAIDASTGALLPAPGSPFTCGVAPTAAAFDPTGRFLFVADRGSNTVAAFAVDPANGALAAVPGSPVAAGSSPAAVAVDPAGRFVYVANSGGNNIMVYTIDHADGSLKPVPTSPVPAGLGPKSIVVDPYGRFVYIVNDLSNNVTAFAVGEDGALQEIPGSPFAAGYGPIAAAIDPSGRFLYVLNAISSDLTVYRIDAESGRLSLPAQPSLPLASGRGALAVDPAGRFVHATCPGANSVLVYRLDAAGGMLTEMPDAALAAGSWPATIAVTHAVMPGLFVSDAVATEPSNGPSELVFTVSLSAPCHVPIRVSYQTADGTATAGGDYVAAAGELLFLPGTTSQRITIMVNADRLAEADETIHLDLAAPVNAVLADGSGLGTINDCPNRPPELNPLSDQAVDEGSALVFKLQAADPDGDSLVYAADNLPAGALLDPSTGEFRWTPGLNQAGTYQVYFSVSDGKIALGQQVTIIVNNVAAAQLTVRLIDYLSGLPLSEADRRSISSVAANALESLESGNTATAVNQLAAFINKVEAMRGGKLSDTDADELVRRATEILAVINGEY